MEMSNLFWSHWAAVSFSLNWIFYRSRSTTDCRVQGQILRDSGPEPGLRITEVLPFKRPLKITYKPGYSAEISISCVGSPWESCWSVRGWTQRRRSPPGRWWRSCSSCAAAGSPSCNCPLVTGRWHYRLQGGERRGGERREGRYTRIQGWILKEQFVTTTTERKGFNNELLFCQNLIVKLTETSAAVDRMKNKWSDFINKRKLRESITGLKDMPADVTTDVHVRESYSRKGLMCFLTVSVKVLPALWIRKKIMATFWEERTLLLSAPESQ